MQSFALLSEVRIRVEVALERTCRPSKRVKPDEQTQRGEGTGESVLPCRLVLRRLDDLRAHPSYIKHRLCTCPRQLNALAALGEHAFDQPIVVTKSGTIIDGYARWGLARQQSRTEILCLEYDLTEEEALRWIIRSHGPSQGMNGYCRSLLAQDLEPYVRENARSNQQLGGQIKGSSTLTEAQKIDVRSTIAAFAGVSSGSFAKAAYLFKFGDPVIQNAARLGEISVHKGWQWSRLPSKQQPKALEDHRSLHGVTRVSRKLIQRHIRRLAPERLIPLTLNCVVTPLIPDRQAVLDSILVTMIDAPGQIAYFTNDAMRSLTLGEPT